MATFIASATGISSVASPTVSTSSTLNIQAGDVLITLVDGGGPGSRVLNSINDGTNNSHTIDQTGNPWGGYVLSGDANASATITATFDGDGNNKWGIIVLQFRPGAGEVFSLNEFGTATAGYQNPATLSSSSVSTTQTNGLIVGWVREQNGLPNTFEFDAVAADGSATADGASDTAYFASAYKLFTSAQTNAVFSFNHASAGTVAHRAVAFNISAGNSVDDINTDEIVEDAESGVTFTTSGFGGEITTATINDGTNSTSASNISSTSGAGTFDLPDVSGYASDTAGSPFTTASHTIQATLGDGTDTANLGVTYNPKAGWAVVEVASAVKTQGSVFENFVGVITDASQVLYPTSNNTTVSATGIITTDATQDIDMQFWDVTDGTWKPFTALIGSGNGDKQVQPVVSSFVLSMVSNTVK